ncbi:PEP-CTERM sorting domain-containing protein [Paraglaciecola sp.]|uniref:PEP-CTERM sorting domain-containing protein n=1 Tax=Paraglaciecola sp. TaxID=1920173 RepID=UPI0030F37A23
MKFKLLQPLFLGITLLMGANTYAGIISSVDTHTTSDGSVVNLSGLDWLSWDATTGQSRTAVENGFGGYIAEGWRYATIAEYNTLMTSVFDTYGGWSYDNSDGASWLYENLYGRIETTKYNNWQYYNLYGSDTECGASNETCRGEFRFYSRSANIDHSITRGYVTLFDIEGSYLVSSSSVNYRSASALVRESNYVITVTEPTTLAIFALGMFGLTSRRFKKQS